MSAFMVADETINCIVTWLSDELEENLYFKKEVIKASKETAIWNDEALLGEAMHQLNIAGVVDRYGEERTQEMRAETTYHYTPRLSSDVQTLKSLRCWLYQCSEGEVMQRRLYRCFAEVIEPYLVNEIIEALPEYETATWG